MLLNEKNQKYKLLVEKLYERSQEVQTENERCVLRINTVKKQIRRRVRDVDLLKRRLDKHNDSWRTLPMVAPHPKRKIEQKRGPKPKVKNPNEEPKEKKARKQRVKKNTQEMAAGRQEPPSGSRNFLGILPLAHQQGHLTEQQAQQLLLQQHHQMQFKQEIMN